MPKAKDKAEAMLFMTAENSLTAFMIIEPSAYFKIFLSSASLQQIRLFSHFPYFLANQNHASKTIQNVTTAKLQNFKNIQNNSKPSTTRGVVEQSTQVKTSKLFRASGHSPPSVESPLLEAFVCSHSTKRPFWACTALKAMR
ncbi:hypothetical protein HY992_03000 [Candidatus Micrarchaeota archaeon]|nr:hypothetical protein [Candidatus Micrarchaeota archaeon]